MTFTIILRNCIMIILPNYFKSLYLATSIPSVQHALCNMMLWYILLNNDVIEVLRNTKTTLISCVY